MKRATSLIVLALALLIAVAFLIRREPREEIPKRSPRRSPVTDASPSEGSPPPVAVKPSVSAPVVVAPAAAGAALPGTVRGLVKIKGEVPRRKIVKLDADPKCQSFHAGVVLSDELVVDAGGNVQWAFVYVKSGPIGHPPPAPTTPVLMDQVACTFVPHMVGVRVGQPLRVLSSDDLLHNVHGLTFLNKEFNVGLPTAGMEVVRSFGRPEVMFLIKCDVHPWMRSWVGVMDHPYFAVTNELGSYVIRELPPGKYTVEAWHEKYVPLPLQIEVPSGGDVRLDFLLDAQRQ